MAVGERIEICCFKVRPHLLICLTIVQASVVQFTGRHPDNGIKTTTLNKACGERD